MRLKYRYPQPLKALGRLLAAHGGELPREEVDRPGEPPSISPEDRAGRLLH